MFLKLLLLKFSIFEFLALTPVPKIYQESVSFDGGNFKVYWSYNSTADSLYFKLDVAATGWVGFGFSQEMRSDMMGYDVMVGGVRNGQMYLKVCSFCQFIEIFYYKVVNSRFLTSHVGNYNCSIVVSVF